MIHAHVEVVKNTKIAVVKINSINDYKIAKIIKKIAFLYVFYKKTERLSGFSG